GDVPSISEGRILGHEAVGTIEEIGDGVELLAVGDRVLVPAITTCGACANCRDGLPSQCTTVGAGGWIFGNVIDGTQAERVRVPFADASIHKVPDALSDEQVLFLADILPTGFEIGVLNGAVKPGDTVVVVGAGPVGLAAILTAGLQGAGTVIAVDLADSRLESAIGFGADLTINSGTEDVVARVKEITKGRGADVTIEAVGVPETFTLAVDCVRAGGHIANVGVHGKPVELQLQDLWIKSITITTGLVNATTIPVLLSLVESGKIDPTRFATHHFALEEIIDAYDTFANAGRNNALKVVLSRA
ncbi:MAG: Alcohol dehydrogenase GroES-like protein, partial [Glaciihabitans sp.]|nr:Alcohol dehydrogenase GroES-like protein [Glaciihabitans sp.]